MTHPKVFAQSRPCIMIGYAPRSKAYCLWDPSNGKIFNSFHVTFVEHLDKQPANLLPGTTVTLSPDVPPSWDTAPFPTVQPPPSEPCIPSFPPIRPHILLFPFPPPHVTAPPTITSNNNNNNNNNMNNELSPTIHHNNNAPSPTISQNNNVHPPTIPPNNNVHPPTIPPNNNAPPSTIEHNNA